MKNRIESQRTIISGPVGALEFAIDAPPSDLSPRAVALVCHPNPTQGGTMDNKVVTTLSKAFTELGCVVARFNYRGVGKSEGAWDNGVGEVDDARAALAALTHHVETPTVVLAGFSFGGFVAAQLAQEVSPAQLVLVGPATSRTNMPSVNVVNTIVIHGEEDEVVPLQSVFDWARPQHVPVTVFPGVGHFFHGQLIPLRTMVKALCTF